eukprot:763448-Hanusia_phi.AAC.5
MPSASAREGVGVISLVFVVSSPTWCRPNVQTDSCTSDKCFETNPKMCSIRSKTASLPENLPHR